MADLAATVGATGAVAAVWAGLFLVAAGVGRTVLRVALGSLSSGATALPVCAWMGYASILVLLQLWHFALPVSGWAWTPVLALAAPGWLLLRRERTSRSEAFAWQPWTVVTLALLAIWAANRATGPMTNFDSANYHLPLIAWFRSFPLVPGLANLSPLYGLNLSGLLFPALLEVGPGLERSSHFGSGFLWLLTAATALHELDRTSKSGRWGPAGGAALIAMWPIVSRIYLNGGYWLTSPSTDLAVLLVSVAATILIARWIEEKSPVHALVAMGLLSTLPLLKATALVYSATCWVVMAILLLQSGRWIWSRTFRFSVAFATVAIGGWLLRGVVLSGYPLLPTKLLGAPVDWRVPAETADYLYWWSQVWARTPGHLEGMIELQDGFQWVPYWLGADLRSGLEEALVPLALIFALGAAAVATRFLRARSLLHTDSPPTSTPALFLLLLPSMFGLAVWFLTAPSVRFGQFLFWSLAVVAGALIVPFVARARPNERPALRTVALVTCVVIASIGVQTRYAIKDAKDRSKIQAWVGHFFTAPGPDRGLHPLYRPALVEVPLCGGQLVIRRPVVGMAELEGAEPNSLLPWSASPPTSTQPVLDELCPREQGNLKAGFRWETGGRSWADRHGSEVRRLHHERGWPLARLAIHFAVPPDVVADAMRPQALRNSP